MSTLRDERQVYALRVRPKSVPKTAPQHTIIYMCKIIEEMWKAQRATFYINDKGTITEDDEAGDSGMISSASNKMTNAIYIADVSIDEEKRP